MIPQWFIEIKRDGHSHSAQDIHTWIRQVTDGSLPDYQLSAWLMAVCLKGMTPEETAALTDAMMHSGETVSFTLLKATVDKHSTGGIGDKISIPLAPLAAAMGMYVPMISGRGLGITGGTLDKLESIHGFRTDLSIETFKHLTTTVGCCMIGQTPTLAPADKRMYAMRDVTGTVPSIPLITASIMSKKLAEGADALLFDVKVGSGAFMRRLEDAQALAQSLTTVGKNLGRTCRALITDMSQPLGATIGNALEVQESMDILAGKGPQDVRELTLLEAAHMAHISGLCADIETAYTLATETLDSGKAMEKFREMVTAQGGDLNYALPSAEVSILIKAPRSGYLAHRDAEILGRVALQLGAGRTHITDILDLGAGISELATHGAYLHAGEPLCRCHAATAEKIERLIPDLLTAFTFTDTPPPPRQLLVAHY